MEVKITENTPQITKVATRGVHGQKVHQVESVLSQGKRVNVKDAQDRVLKIAAHDEKALDQDRGIVADDQSRKTRAAQKRAHVTVQDQKIESVVIESVDVQKIEIVSTEEVAQRMVGPKGTEHPNI